MSANAVPASIAIFDRMTHEQLLEHIKFAHAANAEKDSAIEKAHSEQVSELYARIAKLNKELNDQNESIDRRVVWVTEGCNWFNGGQYMTVRQLIEDFDEKHSHDACDNCTDLACDGSCQ